MIKHIVFCFQHLLGYHFANECCPVSVFFYIDCENMEELLSMRFYADDSI